MTRASWTTPPDGEALALVEHPLLRGLLQQLETEAIEACLAAESDHARAVAAMRARSVREVRRSLKTLAEGRRAGPAGPGVP